MAVTWDQLSTYTWDQVETWDAPLPGGIWMPGIFGANSRALLEIAPGADLTADPSTWQFFDITADLRQDSGVSITKGRSDEASQAQPSKMGLALNNPLGDYTPRRAMSTYYPYMRRDLPIRFSLDPGTGLVERFGGFVDTLTPGWDVSGRVPTVTIAASGVLRRLGQGTAPIKSPLYRAISQTSPLYYWPMEDGAASNKFVGTIGGRDIAVPLGSTVGFATIVDNKGSAPLPDLSNNLTHTSTNVSIAAGGWTVAFEFSAVSSLAGSFQRTVAVLSIDDPTYLRWTITLTDATNKSIGLFPTFADGTTHFPLLSVGTPVVDGLWHQAVVSAVISGGNTTFASYVDGVVHDTLTVATLGNGAVRQILIGDSDDPNIVPSNVGVYSMGHLAIWGSAFPTTVATLYDASTGHDGETVDTRLARVCADEGMPIIITGSSVTTMGPQPVGALLPVVRDCEAADGGVLGDGAGFGLTFQCQDERSNAPVTIAIDVAAGQLAPPFAPVDDDRAACNDATYQRGTGTTATAGAKAQYVDTDHVLAHGRYDTSVTVNTEDDVPLLNKAAWRVHLGTTDIERYPNLSLDLAAAPELADDWLAVSEGSRVTVTNLPDEASDGDVDNLVEGWTEKVTVVDWDIALNCSSAAPWTVSEADDASLQVGSDDTTLHIGINTTALSFTADVVALWSTSGADYPIDLALGGERMTCSAVSGSSSPQTFTISARSVNGVVKAHSIGDSVDTWAPARAAA